MTEKQRTIKQDIRLSGVGLHTGNKVQVLIKPALENQGICFTRTDLANQPTIKASVENIIQDSGIPRCTAIGCNGAVINTVEHLMGVLCGLGIDNLTIEVDGNEMPGLDGSGIDFFNAIKKAGIVEQEAPKAYYEIKEPIGVHDASSSIFVVPDQEYKISYLLDYKHPLLKAQFFKTTVNSEIFEKEIAPCRTFCLEEEAAKLQQSGLGKGATYQNTLVVGQKGVIQNEVRFPDEFARHKVLDFIGDLYLLGRPLKGHVYAIKSGHDLNFELIKKIHRQANFYERRFVPHYDIGQKTELDIQEIMKILPHRYPFLLVDRIIALERGKRAVGIKNITINESYFSGHFPDKPLMPGVLMVEAMAQVGGIVVLTAEAHRNKLGLFMATDKVKFRKMVSPGDQLVIELELVRDRSKIAILHGQTKVNGDIVAEADIIISFVEADFLYQ